MRIIDEDRHPPLNFVMEFPGYFIVGGFHHLGGEFEVGEDLVYVSVGGGHRDQVFPVLREAVERYKKEAPFFKKEYVVDEKGGESGYWVGENPS